MTKPSDKDRQKVRSHFQALLDCDATTLPTATIYPAGWETFVEQFAEALAAERNSLPESALKMLEDIKGCPDSKITDIWITAALIEIRQWQQGSKGESEISGDFSTKSENFNHEQIIQPEDIAELVAALEFYAVKDHYLKRFESPYEIGPEVTADKGHRARSALAKWKSKP
jgi:hypothetical protein